jgi:hypothetical protein
MDNIPYDLLEYFLLSLDTISQIMCAPVCKKWNNILDNIVYENKILFCNSNQYEYLKETSTIYSKYIENMFECSGNIWIGDYHLIKHLYATKYDATKKRKLYLYYCGFTCSELLDILKMSNITIANSIIIDLCKNNNINLLNELYKLYKNRINKKNRRYRLNINSAYQIISCILQSNVLSIIELYSKQIKNTLDQINPESYYWELYHDFYVINKSKDVDNSVTIKWLVDNNYNDMLYYSILNIDHLKSFIYYHNYTNIIPNVSSLYYSYDCRGGYYSRIIAHLIKNYHFDISIDYEFISTIIYITSEVEIFKVYMNLTKEPIMEIIMNLYCAIEYHSKKSSRYRYVRDMFKIIIQYYSNKLSKIAINSLYEKIQDYKIINYLINSELLPSKHILQKKLLKTADKKMFAVLFKKCPNINIKKCVLRKEKLISVLLQQNYKFNVNDISYIYYYFSPDDLLKLVEQDLLENEIYDTYKIFNTIRKGLC